MRSKPSGGNQQWAEDRISEVEDRMVEINETEEERKTS